MAEHVYKHSSALMTPNTANIFTYCIKIVLSTVKFNKNLYCFRNVCILVTLSAVAVIIGDEGRFHCPVFLFFAEHRVSSGFAIGVNTNSQNGLDGSFWNHCLVGRALLKSWLRPCVP